VAYKQKVKRDGGGRATAGDGIQDIKVVKKKKRETQVFFRQKADIAKFDPKKPVNLGTYQFPFAFQVPKDAQSTCVIQGHGSGNTAIVQYQIGVLLVRPGFMKNDLIQKIPVDIIGSLRQDIQPAYVSDTKPVSCCGCIPRGTVTIGAKLKKNAYMAGESINIEYSAHNASGTTLHQLSADLFETFWIKAKKKQMDQGFVIANTVLQHGVKPGMGFGEGTSQAAKTAQLPLPQKIEHNSLVLPTVRVQYNVRVTTATGCCLSAPSVKLPVAIYRLPQAAGPTAQDMSRESKAGDAAEEGSDSDDDDTEDAKKQRHAIEKRDSCPMATAVPYAKQENAMHSPLQVDSTAVPIAIDLDGDGIVDAIGYDTTGDGKVDMLDSDGTGTMDQRLAACAQAQTVAGATPVDTTGDGIADAIGYDTTGDGQIDALDTNLDGNIDKRIAEQQPAAQQQPAAAEQIPMCVATPVADAGGTRQVSVTVPAGVMPGQVLQVQTPEGLMVQVAVPAGAVPGSTFTTAY